MNDHAGVASTREGEERMTERVPVSESPAPA